jgi:hypothetical protein
MQREGRGGLSAVYNKHEFFSSADDIYGIFKIVDYEPYFRFLECDHAKDGVHWASQNSNTRLRFMDPMMWFT